MPLQRTDDLRRLGIIDLGTNSARLLVADVSDDGQLLPVASHRVACRLGEDLSQSGRIDAVAEERTAAALVELVGAARKMGEVTLRIIATYALRAAANGPAVHGRLEERVGVPITVLSGEREAHMALRAAQQWTRVTQEPLVVLDLGGGSLEFAVQPSHPNHAIAPQLLSLPLGSVVMSEGLSSGIVSREETETLAQRVRQMLQRQAPSLRHVAQCVVAAGGTVVCVAAVLGFPEPRNGVRLTTDAVAEVAASLAAMQLSERAAMPAIGDRADIIVAGAVVLLESLRYLGATECIVLEHGVREGALRALAAGEL